MLCDVDKPTKLFNAEETWFSLPWLYQRKSITDKQLSQLAILSAHTVPHETPTVGFQTSVLGYSCIFLPHVPTRRADTAGQSPSLYVHLLKRINVRSVLDVGCGRGISTKWFLDHGVDVLCVEGSKDTIAQSFLPRDRIVQHDFSLGPWWPSKTYVHIIANIELCDPTNFTRVDLLESNVSSYSMASQSQCDSCLTIYAQAYRVQEFHVDESRV